MNHTRTTIEQQLADAIAENERLWDALQDANTSCAKHYDRAEKLQRQLDIAREASRMLNSAFGPRFS